jgi:hypothetical protein
MPACIGHVLELKAGRVHRRKKRVEGLPPRGKLTP